MSADPKSVSPQRPPASSGGAPGRASGAATGHPLASATSAPGEGSGSGGPTPVLGVPSVVGPARAGALPTPVSSAPRRTGLHAAVTTSTPLTFARLGRYHIVTRIAMGGMAEVYLAVHGELSGFRTPVVVKKVLPHLAENQQFIDMFLDEGRIASLLDHPNVVRIYEVGRIGAEHFLAMELVQGKPLSSVIRRAFERGERLEHRIAAFIVAQAAAGLHHAHELQDVNGTPLGLVHRDVSPQNVLVSFEGSVKVIDFGIARALGRISDTQTGGMKGKFGYMSPEQARGEEVDLRTDIFALGVVLWEAICGRRLLHRENDLATMRALLYEGLPKPSSLVAVAPELETIVMRALSRNPKFRFPTARDLGSALERYTVQAGGATTSDLGALMKSYFAQDMAQWQQTVRAAIQGPNEPDPRVSPPPLGSGDLSAGVSLLAVESDRPPARPPAQATFTPRPSTRRGFLLALGGAAVVGAAGVFVGRSLQPRPAALPLAPSAPAPATPGAAQPMGASRPRPPLGDAAPRPPAPTAPVEPPSPSPSPVTPAAPLERAPAAARPKGPTERRRARKRVTLRGAAPAPLNPAVSPDDRKTNPF